MKITKSYLKQIIKEEIERMQEAQGGFSYSSGGIKVYEVEDISTPDRPNYEFVVTGTFNEKEFARVLDFSKSNGQLESIEEINSVRHRNTIDYDFKQNAQHANVLINAVKSSPAWKQKEARLKK